MTLFVNHVASKGGHLEGVIVYDSRDAENPLTVYAENGDLSYDRAQETKLMKLYYERIIPGGGPLQPGPGGTEPAVCHAGGGSAALSDGHAAGFESPPARAHLGPDPG